MGRAIRWCGAAMLAVTAVGTIPRTHQAAGAAPLPARSAESAPSRPIPAADARSAAEAAADRPDRFVPSAAPITADATPQGKWRQLGTNPIGAQPSDNNDIPPQYELGGGQDGGQNAGRITSIVVIPSGSHAGRLVIATAGGGIWTQDAGSPGFTKPWVSRTDQAPSLAIGSVTVDPSNPDHLLAGMGEGNQSGDSFVGYGMLESTDGGDTWTVQNPTYTSTTNTTYGLGSVTDPSAAWTPNQWVGAYVRQGSQVAQVKANSATKLTLTNPWGTVPAGGSVFTVKSFDGEGISQVAIDPGNAQHMFAATSQGLFVTNDGGATWAKPAGGGYATVDGIITAVVIVPGTPGPTVYIGGGKKMVARSVDGGANWTVPSSGIPAGVAANFPYVAMAVAATTPATVYASVGDNANPVVLYRGVDGSNSTWSSESAPDYTGFVYSYGGSCTPPGCEQGNYDNVVAVDPANSSHVLAGGETLVETTNATAATPTWTNVNGTAFGNSANNPLHPDQHAIAFATDGSMWIGNDGGIYHYQGGSVTNDNFGLNVVQFMYGISENVDRGVLGGTQDNATTLGFPTSRWFGMPGHEIAQSGWGWTGINGGDGGPSAYWEGYPPGSNVFAWWGVFEDDQNLYVNGPNFPLTGSAVQITPPEAFDAKTPFTPPLATAPNAADPTNPTLFYGLKDLWRTTNPTASPPTWTKVTSLAKGVSAIAVAPSNPRVVYVGFQDGTVQVSTNGGSTFTSLAGQPFSDTWITGLAVNPNNAKQIVASVSYNYVRSVFTDAGNPTPLPHVAQYAYTTNAATGTWTVITGNLPGSVAVSHVIFDNGAPAAATDAKVYATGAANGASTVWKLVGSGLPNVQVQDLYLDPLTSVLFAATHGRGMWEVHAPIFGAAAAGDNTAAELGGSGAPVGGGNISRVPVLACCPGGPKTNVKTVAAGGAHELTVLIDGSMLAWGANNEGQLGNGATGGYADAPVKVSLPAGRTATAIAAGEDHSLALLDDGSVVAWGRNFEGQLGNGANADSNVPVPVQLPAGKTATAIAAGGNFSLALLNDGSIVSWGSNNLGQLGNGLTGDSNVPVAVSLPAGKSASAIGAGFYHGLALLTDGTAVSWGYNANGQLGDGAVGGPGCGGSCSRVPVAISVPAGVSFTGLDGGSTHSIAKAQDGSVYAWGDNTYGELGIGTNTGSACSGACDPSPVKTKLAKTANAIAVSAGGNFSMALLDSGNAVAWGTNDYGELGNGSPSPSNKPIGVSNSVGSPIAISAGDFDSLMAVAVGDIS